MSELNVAVEIYLNVDVNSFVLFAVKHAAAIRDLSAAVLAIAKAREIFRK